MKIEVAKQDLEAALGVVSIAASASGTDITTHFIFRYKEDLNVVEVLANNNRLGASMPMICNTNIDSDVQAFTVESWRLKQWISAVQDAALTLELVEGQVKATSPTGSVKFPSLDPKLFPYWDETFEATEPGVKVQAKRLNAALVHTRLFISDKDTTTPQYAVTEVKEESLLSSDKAALAVVTLQDKEFSQEKDAEGNDVDVVTTVPVLTESHLRLHGKDLGHVLSFLSSCGDDPVEIREHDKATFFIREDGGALTVGRPVHAFPDITLDKKPDDPHWWTVKTDDLRSAVKVLVASAAREDHKLNFRMEKEMVGLSMNSVSGDRSTLHLEALEHGSMDPDAMPKNEEGELEDLVPMPEEGFNISYPYLLKLLGQYKSETIRFGRFREERGGDDYLTLLVWLLH
jgi:hypothetical protein